MGCDVPCLATESQHESAVGHLEHVGQVVADHHHGQAALAQPFDELEHLRRLTYAQRGSRLVEHHQLGLAQQRAGDRHLLTLAPEKRSHLRADVDDRDREGLEQLTGLPLHGGLVELARDPRRPLRDLLATEEEVLHDVEVVAQRQVLVDGGDAKIHGVVGARDLHLVALEPDLPVVGRMDAGDGLHQRRLPAPLSPTRATTSPGRTSKSTSLSAWTGPKLLLTPLRASTGWSAFMAAAPLLSVPDGPGGAEAPRVSVLGLLMPASVHALA